MFPAPRSIRFTPPPNVPTHSTPSAAWANEVIVLLLSVEAAVLETEGAVSKATAIAMAEPAAPSIVTHLANDQARGTAAGLYHMCQFMGSFFGGLVGGYMLDRPEELGVLLILGSLTWFALASGLPDLGPGGVRRD